MFQGGESQTQYCTDREISFRQESYFHWMFGVREPDCYGAVHISTGRSILFVPRLPESYVVWMGTIHPLSHFKSEYVVDEVHYTDEIAQVLLKFGAKKLLTLKGKSHCTPA